VAESDAVAVMTANTAYYTAFEDADIDAMNALWLDGEAGRDVLCVHPGWPPLRGRARIMRSWSVIMANTPYIQFVITDVEVDVWGDVAVLSCSENVLTGSDDPTDTTLGFTSGLVVATNVFRRTDSGWRLWAHHSSPVLSAEDEDLSSQETRGVEDGPNGD
jgi:ketosteroid isomerase-like protein